MQTREQEGQMRHSDVMTVGDLKRKLEKIADDVLVVCSDEGGDYTLYAPVSGAYKTLGVNRVEVFNIDFRDEEVFDAQGE